MLSPQSIIEHQEKSFTYIIAISFMRYPATFLVRVTTGMSILICHPSVGSIDLLRFYVKIFQRNIHIFPKYLTLHGSRGASNIFSCGGPTKANFVGLSFLSGVHNMHVNAPAQVRASR